MRLLDVSWNWKLGCTDAYQVNGCTHLLLNKEENWNCKNLIEGWRKMKKKLKMNGGNVKLLIIRHKKYVKKAGTMPVHTYCLIHK